MNETVQEAVVLHAPIVLSVDLCDPLPENANVQPPDVFASIVENIRTHGFTEPLVVYLKPDGRYGIINGEHRWRAARSLGMKEVTAVVLPITEEDVAELLSIRWNYGRGKLDPVVFTNLFNRLRKTVDPRMLRQAMGIGDEAAFQRLYKDVRATLPPEVQRRLDKTKKEITTVHDLADAVRLAMARYGRTVEFNLLMFEFGGRVHTVVRLNDRGFKNLSRIIDQCAETQTDVNVYLGALLENDDGIEALLHAEPVATDDAAE